MGISLSLIATAIWHLKYAYGLSCSTLLFFLLPPATLFVSVSFPVSSEMWTYMFYNPSLNSSQNTRVLPSLAWNPLTAAVVSARPHNTTHLSTVSSRPFFVSALCVGAFSLPTLLTPFFDFHHHLNLLVTFPAFLGTFGPWHSHYFQYSSSQHPENLLVRTAHAPASQCVSLLIIVTSVPLSGPCSC